MTYALKKYLVFGDRKPIRPYRPYRPTSMTFQLSFANLARAVCRYGKKLIELPGSCPPFSLPSRPSHWLICLSPAWQSPHRPAPTRPGKAPACVLDLKAYLYFSLCPDCVLLIKNGAFHPHFPLESLGSVCTEGGM